MALLNIGVSVLAHEHDSHICIHHSILLAHSEERSPHSRTVYSSIITGPKYVGGGEKQEIAFHAAGV